MLGTDWLEANGCGWDFKTGMLCIDGQPAAILYPVAAISNVDEF